MHLPYRCRDAGACCTSGWPIPLERVRAPAIAGAISAGRLRAPSNWLHHVPEQPADVAGVLRPDASGRCVFHSAGCEIHRALGHEALPSACRHFPRQCLIDARGVFVTLSHYCPTAASLLFDHPRSVEIVAGPSPVNGVPEGFDARDAWPPLLTPRVLMQQEDYAAWEAHMVRVLAASPDDGQSAEEVLATLHEHAMAISRWRLGNTLLLETIHALDCHRRHDTADFPIEWRLFELARSSVTPTHDWPGRPTDSGIAWSRYVETEWTRYAPVVRRFLAAHAFASWMAYQGTGVRSMIDALRVALAVLRIEAIRVCSEERRLLDATRLRRSIRRADLLLVHLIDRQLFARRLSAEGA